MAAARKQPAAGAEHFNTLSSAQTPRIKRGGGQRRPQELTPLVVQHCGCCAAELSAARRSGSDAWPRAGRAGGPVARPLNNTLVENCLRRLGSCDGFRQRSAADVAIPAGRQQARSRQGSAGARTLAGQRFSTSMHFFRNRWFVPPVHRCASGHSKQPAETRCCLSVSQLPSALARAHSANTRLRGGRIER